MKTHTSTAGHISRGAILLVVLMGICIGISGYTFRYAEGLSYFSTDPRACMNCHIMQPQYDSWLKSSHHSVASCVDCHLPHDVIGKYIAKAENGYHHSRAFTFQDFHEPIQIKEKNHRILQHNCIDCHQEMTEHMVGAEASSQGELMDCTRCHQSVGHGERAGLGGPERRQEQKGSI